jgi:hypothetical protein
MYWGVVIRNAQNSGVRNSMGEMAHIGYFVGHLFPPSVSADSANLTTQIMYTVMTREVTRILISSVGEAYFFMESSCLR